MLYTKLTTMTWGTEAEQYLEPIVSARNTYIDNARFTLQVTDGKATVVSPTVTTRVWTDQAAADDWATFISTLATDNGATCDVSVTDNV